MIHGFEPNELPDLEELNVFLTIGSTLLFRLPQTACFSRCLKFQKCLLVEPTGEFEAESFIKTLKNKKNCNMHGISKKLEMVLSQY